MSSNSDQRYAAKLRIMMNFAKELASLSTCKRAKVGCVVVPASLTEVLAIGYNGPPSGTSNDSCTNEVGVCGCVHAEANALVKLKTEHTGLMLVTTCSPCRGCAGLIVNSGAIRWVVYGEQYRDTSAGLVLENSGVRPVTISQIEKDRDLCQFLRHS
jgi:deoxycytidylate deaminase